MEGYLKTAGSVRTASVRKNQRKLLSWARVRPHFVQTDLMFRNRGSIYMEGFTICGWDCIILGCRWRHGPQPISSYLVGLRFPHRVGWYRPGGPPLSSSVCWRCRCKEYFLIWGSDLILPGWRWLHEPQPISNESVGSGPTPCGVVSTRGIVAFVPALLEL